MKIESLDVLLREHPFFRDMKPEHLELLAGCGKEVRFDAGQKIASQGEDADRFYIIRYGKVAVTAVAGSGGAFTIQTLAEGEVMGWSWLFPPYRWHFDSEALELTRAIALDAKCIRRKFDDDAALGYEMMKRFAWVVVERLHAARIQLIDVYGVRR